MLTIKPLFTEHVHHNHLIVTSAKTQSAGRNRLHRRRRQTGAVPRRARLFSLLRLKQYSNVLEQYNEKIVHPSLIP